MAQRHRHNEFKNFKKEKNMLSKRTANKGQSFIEYITMIIFILIALIVFQIYIARGIYGRWKAAG
ncbi:MAG TPA: hypothetical protein PKH98_06910, partial [Candidatus Omnitrophota bacterium]|nr:hypothetical protein [Candidatus Omnitrophota bacterium]